MMRTFGFACGGWLPAGESWAGLSRPVRMVMPRGPWLRTYETASGRRGSWCQWRWADDGDAVAGLLIESGEFRRCLGEIYSVLDETLRAEPASRDLGQHGRVVVGCHPVATHDFKLRGDDGGHGHRRRVVGAQHQSDLDVAPRTPPNVGADPSDLHRVLDPDLHGSGTLRFGAAPSGSGQGFPRCNGRLPRRTLEVSGRRPRHRPEGRAPTMDDMHQSFARQGLVRPQEGRVLAGVCAGLGRRFGIRS